MSPEMKHNYTKSDHLLITLQQLLELPATTVNETIHQAAQLVTQALQAEKVDVFLYDPGTDRLIAFGTSLTPMGIKQKALGLDQIPLSAGGRVVEAYQTGQPFWTGQAHLDPVVLPRAKEELAVKSEIVVPLLIDGQRRGVLLGCSSFADFFTEQDVHFLQAIAHWVGVVIHRAELVEEHTHQLTEQARRLAAEEMLAIMAHDLGNYLTPLKARLDLLERRARREKQEGYVRELEVTTQITRRLHTLISNLLDAERLKQGLFSLDPQMLDLVELAEELVPIWSVAEHPIRLQAPEALTLSADRDRIQQVIENLLSNAVTHAEPETSIEMVLSQEQRSDGLWAVLRISNQGADLSPQRLASLFEPFVKGSHSQGLGLGLWLSQRIAQAHQGTLTAEVEANKTITLILSLPMRLPLSSSLNPSRANENETPGG